ncbi:MAG: hypothetical protein FVQ79_03535 [Planctomycetes bacterium]|nr:hypothetical protein [Planctomycetota bacterium]
MPKTQKKKKSVKKSVKKKVAPKSKKSGAKKKPVPEPVLEIAEEDFPGEIIPGIEESEFELEDLADISEERASIISIVKGLEGQVETAFMLKEVLEDELDITRQKLSEEMEVRAQLEVQVNSLQDQADLAGQLRQDISYAEEERNRFADELAQTRQEFKQAATERDLFTEQISHSEANVRELEGERMALEAQVMNLKDNITDADRLRKELAEITQAHRQSREQAHDVTRRLETLEASKKALESQLTGSHQNAQNLRDESEQFRRKYTNVESELADLRIQHEDQQVANRDLMQTNAHLENEIKGANISCESAKNELGAFKNALRDIRSEATRTSGRVRQRYFKPDSPTRTSSQKTKVRSPRK